jgi:hypothetical protein
MSAPRAKPKFVVRDTRSREDFKCYSADAARHKLQQLKDNGRTAYVTPPLPPENPFHNV